MEEFFGWRRGDLGYSPGMRIYLVRHGEAVPSGYAHDGDRPLTDEGRARVKRTAAVWVGAGEPAPELWLVSPLVRAVQTAELYLGAFGKDGPLAVSRALEPAGRLFAVVEMIDRFSASRQAIALVGHQPLLGEIGAQLLGIGALPGPIEPGGVLAVDLTAPESPGRFAFYLEPAKPGRDARFSGTMG